LAIEARALLGIINKLFKTDCHDPDAIDAANTWAIIVEELSSYYQSALTLAIRYQSGMNLNKTGKILGVTRACVCQRCERAMRHLRDPRRINRIRNSILGLQNLYRHHL
ncbi:MAG TPA: sigma factor-like helix-turn-helix DNA-binding protein, partial [Verrucomicrobiae bacterium]